MTLYPEDPGDLEHHRDTWTCPRCKKVYLDYETDQAEVLMNACGYCVHTDKDGMLMGITLLLNRYSSLKLSDQKDRAHLAKLLLTVVLYVSDS